MNITISTTADIDAPKQLVWDVLTDFAGHSERGIVADLVADCLSRPRQRRIASDGLRLGPHHY
jgi:hypothetical protein